METNETVQTLEQLAAIVAPGATGQKATDQALWFLSLFEASQTEGHNGKDLAHLFLGGLPRMADSWAESLATVGQLQREDDNDDSPTTADEVLLVADDLGWF